MKTNTTTLSNGTVYLIDDHPVILGALTALINADPELSVVGHAMNWPVAFSEIARLKPDITVLDITLAGANGIEILKNLRIQVPKQRVLMLSMHDESLYAARSMKAGASGYLMKASASEEVVIAIKQILRGEAYLSPGMSRKMLSALAGRKAEGEEGSLAHLSDRELEIYQLVGSGLTTRKIAERLHLSVKTIETHKFQVKQKLGFQNHSEMTRNAIHAIW
jgi:DNA-binding NarL/FixJ family response regulator